MDEINFTTISKMTKEEARQFLEELRWPDGAVCPHCGHDEAYKIHPRVRSQRLALAFIVVLIAGNNSLSQSAQSLSEVVYPSISG